MYIPRLLILLLLVSVCVAPLTAQTKQLPSGCMYMLEIPLWSMLRNPFPPPVPFTERPFRQGGISLMPIIATPQFRVQIFPLASDSVVTRKTTFVTNSPSIVCGFHPNDFAH
jgi:hypothetical protein